MAMLDRTYGIEVECFLPSGKSKADLAAYVTGLGVDCREEGYNHTTRTWWKVITDGSLGSYVRGVELVSPVLKGEQGFVQARTAIKALEDFGCLLRVVPHTNLCGVHVHVGVGRPPIEFWQSLIKLYGFYEPAIDRVMPASRRDNGCYYAKTVRMAAHKIDQATSVSALSHALKSNSHAAHSRYHKVNLVAYDAHRTVEFRQHGASVDAGKIETWTRMCLRMVDRAALGFNPTGAASTAVASANNAAMGSKTWIIGQLALRPEGVTTLEAIQATGWRELSLAAQLRSCGLQATRERSGRIVRYYAQAGQVAASTAPVAGLEGLFETLACPEAERDFFRAREARFFPPVAPGVVSHDAAALAA